MHAIRILSFAILFAALVEGDNIAHSDPAKATSVVLAPVTSVGNANKELRNLEILIEEGISLLPKTQVIGANAAAKATRKAKRPELRTCDGDTQCLKNLGALLNASYVVYGEVSDLGDAHVVYLKSVDVRSGDEVRSTTLKLSKGSNRKKESKAAAARLLAPDLYVGTLKVQSTVAGAAVFLDGHKIGTTPSPPVSVYVGSHAMRVTHPEHSDYVRFVDVRFEEETVVDAELLGLPGLDQKLKAEGVLGGTNADNLIVNHRPTPWYLRWYTITGGVAAVALTSAVLASGGSSFSADLIRDL